MPMGTFGHSVLSTTVCVCLQDQFHYILESANELVTKWQTMINNSDEKYGAEVAIDLDLPETLLEIIIKTTFGSTTVEGSDIRAIHKAVRFMVKTLGSRLSGYGRLFPGFGCVPQLPFLYLLFFESVLNLVFCVSGNDK
jgi:hypothetical protein